MSGIHSKQLKSNGNKLPPCNLDLSDWDESSEQLPLSLSSSSSLLLGYGESHLDNVTIIVMSEIMIMVLSRDARGTLFLLRGGAGRKTKSLG